MQLIKEFYCAEGLDLSAPRITRDAVRAVVLDAGKILMIHSSVNGDYKIPGGGVEAGESHEATLVRELSEECGAEVTAIVRGIGNVIEYDRAKEAGSIFVMTSHYYLCTAHRDGRPQKLDDYEKALAFTPVWVDIGNAITNNKELLAKGTMPRWTRRDTFMLEYIASTIIR